MLDYPETEGGWSTPSETSSDASLEERPVKNAVKEVTKEGTAGC